MNDNAGLSLLQSGVKAQPACAGGHAGKADEKQFLSGNMAQGVLLFRHEDHDPCHDQNDNRSNGGTKIGIYVFNADLA
ncbi:hypothetical protein KWG61_03010 [Allobaculum sp. Allo2]|nr:hypothetical protein KWG61_03010 [Allobaculum sp. Allo2]